MIHSLLIMNLHDLKVYDAALQSELMFAHVCKKILTPFGYVLCQAVSCKLQILPTCLI